MTEAEEMDKAMAEWADSMYAIPQACGKQFQFALSPSPEYRSAVRDIETGEVIAIRWDDTADRWIQPDEE